MASKLIICQNDIVRTKKKLIAKALKTGLYENFGQNEVSMLRDKHVNISSYTDEMNSIRDAITAFSDWCENFNDSQIEKERKYARQTSV